MRIESVTAHAFGPLVDETLSLAPGMTVIVGGNESGKSSWHAAIFAALCGRRRGAGRPREDEQRFIDAHKPWDINTWLVTAQIRLDDGRRIEMRQDLAGRVDCHARDLDVGWDISAEVMNDGTPDASRWLGLDRTSFVSTACVEQAQMLRVRGEAGGLQQHLQRAAATAGADSTAAAALSQIAAFRSEHVGLDRSNSTKPLRRALDALRVAQERLDMARAEHERYLQLAQRTEELANTARDTDAVLEADEAAAAADDATEKADRVKRATELHERLGDSAPPTVAEDDALARQVTVALTAWRMRPERPAALGPTAAQIRERLSEQHAVIQNGMRRLMPSALTFAVSGAAAVAGIAMLATVSHVGGIAVVAGAVVLAILGAAIRRREPGAVGARRTVERQALQAQLEAAKHAEQRAQQDLEKLAEATRLVTEAATACALTVEEPELAAAALEQWLARRQGQIQLLGASQREWAELQVLLDGRTLQEMRDEAALAAAWSCDLAGKVDPGLLATISPGSSSDDLANLRDAARLADRTAAQSAGDLQRFASSITSVPEAEEAAQAAADDLSRIRELEETLTLASQFLQRAQERVHRDIAPALAATIRRSLPAMTADRYTDVTVNPMTLQVEVCGASRQWRQADLLSYGTAELIYLLLRIALADHLTRGHDTCPLVLDDVTVHADGVRTRDILDMLLLTAEERQVILFTQEDRVATWAGERLTAPAHAVRSLRPLANS